MTVALYSHSQRTKVNKMSYTIRNETGIMVAEISGDCAETILKSAQGEWHTYNVEGESQLVTVCFEVAENCVYTIEGVRTQNTSLKLYLWEGYKIIPNF